MNTPSTNHAFVGTLAGLSNMAAVSITTSVGIFPSVEHAYQAAKFADRNYQQKIRLAGSAAEAKRLGRANKDIRPDWEDRKVGVMLYLLRLKFDQEPYKSLLLSVDDSWLVEYNYWGDTFWGVCRGEGQNMLGKLLKQVKYELLSAEKS